MAYLTPEQAALIVPTNGTDFTVAELSIAAQTIELRTGIIEEQVPTLFGRDAKFIRSAIAYQAAWLRTQPDAFERVDVENLSQDGVSFTPKASGLTLAPFAKKALARLSWRGTRSTTSEQRDAAGPASAKWGGDFGSSADDDVDAYGRPLDWRPL